MPQRLGSLLLTAPIIARFLTSPGDDAQEDPSQYVPELAELLGKCHLEVPALKGLSPEDCFKEQRHGVTSLLQRHVSAAQLTDALLLCPSDQHRAWLLSCGGEGARFLMVDPAAQRPYGTPGLAPEELRALMLTRLGLLPHDDAVTSGNCDRNGCNQPVDPAGLHNTSCLEKGKGGLMGRRPKLHAGVKRALQRTMWRLAKERQLLDAIDAVDAVGSKEPNPSEPPISWPSNPAWDPGPGGEDTACRGDILVKGLPGNEFTVLDVVITTSKPTASKHCATVVGYAAKIAGDRKVTLYNKRYLVPAGAFRPFALETGGRMDPRARGLLSDFARMLVGKERQYWEKPDLLFYARAMKEMLDSVAVATAKGVAQALLADSRAALHPPAPGVGQVVSGPGGA